MASRVFHSTRLTDLIAEVFVRALGSWRLPSALELLRLKIQRKAKLPSFSGGRLNSTDLARALLTAEIWPAFQPLIDLKTSKVVGFEVLARWTHPQKGAISPACFIPVAEAAGLIDILTDRIISLACQQASSLGDKFFLAFNISAIQLKNPELFTSLKRIVGATDFPLDRIHIEVTESALIETTDITRATMSAFRREGLGLALDDFGTGFASLTQLHSFPFDTIKIDASFVMSMESDSGSRKIVASVIGLGQSLGLKVVAEGVETEKQASILRHMGCDVVQGFLFGRPLPWDLAKGQIDERGENEGSAASPATSHFQRIHQLEALYQSAPIGLCMLGIDLVHLSMNDRFAAMMGMRSDQMLGKSLYEFLPAGEADRIDTLLRCILDGEPSTLNEYTSPTGGVFLVVNERVEDAAGEPIGITVTAIDITQHKAHERLIRLNEECFRKTLELQPSIMWAADSNGALDYISPSGEIDASLFDRIATWQDRIHSEDRDRVRTEWLDHLPSGKPFETRFRLRSHEGGWRWVSSKAVPSEIIDGRPSKWYGVINEVGQTTISEIG